MAHQIAARPVVGVLDGSGQVLVAEVVERLKGAPCVALVLEELQRARVHAPMVALNMP